MAARDDLFRPSGKESTSPGLLLKSIRFRGTQQDFDLVVNERMNGQGEFTCPRYRHKRNSFPFGIRKMYGFDNLPDFT